METLGHTSGTFAKNLANCDYLDNIRTSCNSLWNFLQSFSSKFSANLLYFDYVRPLTKASDVKQTFTQQCQLALQYAVVYSGVEQPTSGRTLRLGSWNTVNCREGPDVMARAYLWDIYLILRHRVFQERLLKNKQRASWLASRGHDIINLVIQKLLKYSLLLLSCILTPILRLQRFKKQKRIPTIKNHLLLISATKIARAIRRKHISSEEVVRAYVERCVAVNPVLNAIVDQRYDKAIEEAREVDEFLASTPITEEELAHKKPLFGVPITVKESFAVKGMSHSAGVKKNISRRATQDAEAVSLLRKAGAIVTVVSNTPELCLHYNSTNYVTGTTWNPYDTNRTCSGSSGGEGALISSAASIVGVASDLAGSARIPALFCGVFGHKTTPGIIPRGGHIPDFKSLLEFTTCTMVRYAEDLSLMLKNMCQSEKVRKNLEQKVSLKEIRYFYLDHCCPITNSLNEDIKQAINKLKIHMEETYNLKVEKARLPNMQFTFAMFMVLLEMKFDLTEEIDRMGPFECLLGMLKCFIGTSEITLTTLTFVMLRWISRKLFKSCHYVYAKKDALKKEFEELLDDNGVLIFPTFVSPALYPGEFYMNICNIIYLVIANVLALPSTHCPMGINKAGLPVGLQIMANTNNDHLTIAVAEEIERAFGGWQPPPMNPV